MSTVNPQIRSFPSNGNTSQVLVASGFLALDLLYRNKASHPARKYAGGSFGNVTAILAYLGWKSYPVARIGADTTANKVISDLKNFSVETKFICREAKTPTPMIVVRTVEKWPGRFESRFEWKHPRSGERLPAYRPLPKFMAANISPLLPDASVYYFDRAEPSSIFLAKEMRDRGALVFFEPSSCKDMRLFTEAMAISDIVKYSVQRIVAPLHTPNTPSPRLEIQTLGDQGLRYRVKNCSSLPGPWTHLEPFPINKLKDATGCGDWCSAGILHKIGKRSREEFLSLDEPEIKDALNFGQALAAINGEYEGARGPMYENSKQAVLKKAKMLSENRY